MRKNNGVYLKQILEYIEDIDGYLDGVSFEEFEDNGLLQDGVIRKIELIGETARRLTGVAFSQSRVDEKQINS